MIFRRKEGEFVKQKWEEDLEKSLLGDFWPELALRCGILGGLLLIAIAFLILGGAEAAGVLSFLVAAVAFLVLCVPVLLDVPAARKRCFEKALGEVVRYEETGLSYGRRRFYPVVKDDITGEEKMFRVHIQSKDMANRFAAPATGIGERYLFLYLKNSKIVACRKEPKSYGEEE